MGSKHAKIRVGITGQSGFIGTNLYNHLGLAGNIERINFKREYFEDRNALKKFVSRCDVIVHLAGVNRHADPQVIYETNINLSNRLIEACNNSKSIPHIIFSSSTQEKNSSIYGKSKLDSRKLFEKSSNKESFFFSSLTIPNVFGPFGKPYYNSFISTFCHQLTHNEKPHIDIDSEVELIYIDELIKIFINQIINKNQKEDTSNTKYFKSYDVDYTSRIKVSKVLRLLETYKKNYFGKGMIPSLENNFEKNLFITFFTYIDHQVFFPFYLTKHSDDRGSFIETIKLNSGGQVSFSTTVSDITRGNHYHTRKLERFAVIKGKAKIELRKIGTDQILTFKLNGDKPSFVDMPVWYTHNITNIGEEELYTIFWINEEYDPDDADTFFEFVRKEKII